MTAYELDIDADDPHLQALDGAAVADRQHIGDDSYVVTAAGETVLVAGHELAECDAE